VADATGRSPRPTDGRIRLLASTYEGIARRYDELESLSRREHELLAGGGAMSAVQEILQSKRELLARIRAEEESVAETKSWWTRARRTLPPAETRELLDVLDAVSRRIERALAIEADCRALLARSTAFRANGAPSSGAARLSAAAAYHREQTAPGGGR
jgi:hypothetical protein